MDDKALLDVLKNEMTQAMGCTEPAAAALCAAKARELLEGVAKNHKLSKLTVTASRDMVKNAMAVSIPSSGKKGISFAAALGYAIGDASNGLNLLSGISEEQKEAASNIKTELVLRQDVPSLYISVRADCETGDNAVAIISGAHDRISHTEVNGEVLSDEPQDVNHADADSREMLASLTFDDAIGFAESAALEDLDFIADAIKTNTRISDFSLREGFGLEVGKTMLEGISEPVSSLKDAFSKGAALAAAGSDARMSGCPMPVVINSGSGNQGITVTVPVKVVADYLRSGDEKTIRAVCVSELVGLTLTARKGRLSALCGVFTAAIGTACAWVYLLGGGSMMMGRVLRTMVANLAGIICDGAKSACALKIYSSLECASMSVRLALKGFSPEGDNGILGSSISQTIDNLMRLCNEGMRDTDKTIVSMMVSGNQDSAT